MDINKIKKISSGLLLLSAASLPLSSAYATSADLTVSAKVLASCTTSTSAVSFGDYDLAIGNQAQGSITMTCTNGTLYNIGLGAGSNSVSFTDRKMIKAGGSETLPYSLYSNADRSANWGSIIAYDDTGGKTGTGTGAVQTINVYGSIASGQTSPIGTYSDTVAVIVVLGN